jgi:hypothetical protein
MAYFKGFQQEILEALQSKVPEIKYQAILAAGNWGITDACPEELLDRSSDNDDIIDAAYEALAMLDELFNSHIINKNSDRMRNSAP